MKVTFEGELADTLIAGSERNQTGIEDQLKRCIAIYQFLQDQEAAGMKVLVEDPKANTVQQVIVSNAGILDESDHIAL